MKKTKEDKDYIRNVIINGTPEEKLAIYQFDNSISPEELALRFNLFVVGNFVRYYQDDSAPFHKEMIEHYAASYLKKENYLNIGFRGCAKTSLKKLFDVYVLLNDASHSRKFIKVMTKDIKNSKQIVTDVYNMIVEVDWLYGDPFEKEGKKKQEETMIAFTLKDGRRYAGGTVGQTQRGQVQDAYRPDWVWFEDIEDSATIKSMVQTQSIIEKSDEAIQGMSDDGNYVVTANYISEEGTVQWYKNKKIQTQIIPIIDKEGTPTWGKYSKEKIISIKDDSEDWEGDYLCDPTSGKDKFFNVDQIKADIERTIDPIKVINDVKVWEEYSPQYKYAIGADTAEGVGRDANAFVMFNFSNNTVVSTFYSNEIPPDMLGYELARHGRLYGECLVAPELNNTGHATIAALQADNYGNIYRDTIIDTVTHQETKKLGFSTTRKTKPVIWFDFKKDYESGIIKIHDKELLEEMLHYTKADFNERTTGIITRHFDLLTAAVIGWHMKEYAEVTIQNKEFQLSY